MDFAKTILGLAGGALIGLYVTGHDVAGVVGLQFDKQLYVGLLAFITSLLIHVALGGDLWPNRKPTYAEYVALAKAEGFQPLDQDTFKDLLAAGFDPGSNLWRTH